MNTLKFRILYCLIFFTTLQTLSAQSLSENAEISLLTLNPGKELYLAFGHSAIRVKDYDRGIDWVYNYGTFDFNVPNFYVKFLRGYLNYQLEAGTMPGFVAEYQSENRSIYEQVLNLTLNEKNEIFRFLEYNRLPENKYYLYDFFFDNCATRIRDVFQKELKDKLNFDKSKYSEITFRQMLKPSLENRPWGRFGINLVLGAVADRKGTLNETMFLPDFMKLAFENASVSRNSKIEPLVKSSNLIFKQAEDNQPVLLFTRPGFVLWSVFLIVALFTFFEFKRKVRYKIIDFLVFLSIGIIGMIMFLMWFGTNHTAVVKNWNLMWAIPSHLIIAFMIFRKSKSGFLRYYFLITGVITFSVLPLWSIIPQQYDLAFIPLIMLSTLRSFKLFRDY